MNKFTIHTDPVALVAEIERLAKINNDLVQLINNMHKEDPYLPRFMGCLAGDF